MTQGRGPIMFNLRVRPTEPLTPVTKAALQDVLRHIKTTDEVPPGWEVSFIEWNHPGRGSSGWRRGTSEDLAFLGRIIRKMGGLSFRAAEVEGGGVVPTPKQQKALNKAAREADRWHRARAKEMRQIDKLKTVEARDRHRAAADKYRQRYVKAQQKVEKIGFGIDRPEFELAVDYKGKRGR